MSIEKVNLCELIEDVNLYPRMQVDAVHVLDLAEAIRAGVKLPPIVVDRHSKKIADGFHRARAHRIVFGQDANIDAILKDYSSPSELFFDAVSLNAPHGKGFNVLDRERSLQIAQKLKIDWHSVAKAMGLRAETAEGIITPKASLSEPSFRKNESRNNAGRQAVPSRKDAKYLLDQVDAMCEDGVATSDCSDELDDLAVEPEPPEAHERHVMHLNALVRILEQDELDWADGWIRTRVLHLRNLLNRQLDAPIPKRITTGED